MNTHMIVGIYVILIQNMITGEVQYYPKGINWFNASKGCKMKGLGLEHDNFTLSTFDELKGRNFWIGIIMYKETSPWIETIGCYNVSRNHKAATNSGSIVDCQHHCNSSAYFSYQKVTKQCRCLTSVNAGNNVNLNECSNQNVPNDYALVYKQFDVNRLCDTSVDNEPKDCIVSTCRPSVKLCSHNCSSTNTVKTLCADGYPPTNHSFWTYNYSTARQKCYGIGKRLLPTEYCGHTNTPSWTNAFRTTEIMEYFEAKSESVNPVACQSGKFVNSTGKQQLQLLPKSCLENLKYFACKPNHTVMTTKEPSITGPLVGGLIGGSLIIIVSIFILIWNFRRSNKCMDKKKRTEELSSQREQKHEIPAENLQYGLVEEEVKDLPDSAVVTKEHPFVDKSLYEYAEIKEKRPITPDATYDVAKEDDYDKLNNLSRKITGEKNIYGIVGHCGEDDYDTTNSLSTANVNGLYDMN